MLKEDLKTGMRVKLRNGDIYLVIKDVERIDGYEKLAFINKTGFLRGSNYNNELINEHSYSSSFDIMEVYLINDNPKSLLNSNLLDLEIRYSIWKRQEYTDRQKEVFKALRVLGFNYIARDTNIRLFAYKSKPQKSLMSWIGDSSIDSSLALTNIGLDFIKWEDSEPFEIPEL